jgi:hypothetical protein
VDFTDAALDAGILVAMKEAAVFDKFYVQKSAWIGTEGILPEFRQTLTEYSLREFPSFKTREEALDWLVQGLNGLHVGFAYCCRLHPALSFNRTAHRIIEFEDLIQWGIDQGLTKEQVDRILREKIPTFDSVFTRLAAQHSSDPNRGARCGKPRDTESKYCTADHTRAAAKTPGGQFTSGKVC